MPGPEPEGAFEEPGDPLARVRPAALAAGVRDRQGERAPPRPLTHAPMADPSRAARQQRTDMHTADVISAGHEPAHAPVAAAAAAGQREHHQQHQGTRALPGSHRRSTRNAFERTPAAARRHCRRLPLIVRGRRAN